MPNFFQKIHDFLTRPTHSRTVGLLAIFILASAVFLTVTVAQQQQTLKQKAYSTCQNLILGMCVENYCNGRTCSQKPNCPPPLVNYSGDYASCPYGQGCCAAADQSSPVEPPNTNPQAVSYGCDSSCLPGCCEWDDPMYGGTGQYYCDTWAIGCVPEGSGYRCEDYGMCGSYPYCESCTPNYRCEDTCPEGAYGCVEYYCWNNTCVTDYTSQNGVSCWSGTGVCNNGNCEETIQPPSAISCQDSTTGNGNNCDGDNGHFEGYCSTDHVFINLYKCNSNSCQAETPYRCSDSDPSYTCQINFAGVPQCLPSDSGPTPTRTPTPNIRPTTPPNYPTTPPITYPTPIGAPTPTSILAGNVTLVSALNAQDVTLTADNLTANLMLYNLSTNTQVTGAPNTQIYNSTAIPGRQYSATITLSNLYQEQYFIVIRKDNMIAKSVFAVSNSNRTITVPTTTLVFGDVNSDNNIDITDYNIFKNCWKQSAVDACAGSDFDQTGGTVNEIDYNTWLRGFKTWQKEGQGL